MRFTDTRMRRMQQLNCVAQIPPSTREALDRSGTDRLWLSPGTLCAVCLSRTRGFGWFNPHQPRPHRIRRWFCSMGCQAVFTRKAKKGPTMVEFTNEETQVLPAVMRALAPEMERIGWERPLGQLSQGDMQQLIITTINAFRAEMSNTTLEDEIPF